MDNSQQPWVDQGYLTKQDYENAQIAEFVMTSSPEEVLKRKDLFNRILNEGDLTPSNLIRSDRTFLLGDLVEDIRKIPEEYYSSTVFRLASADLTDAGKTFETQLKELWPEVKLKPNLNLVELQKKAKKIANGLDNLYKIALYDKAEGDLNTVQVLKNHSDEDLKQLLEKVKKVDATVALRIKNRQSIDKKIEGLVEIMQASGRTDLEIDDILTDDDIYKIKTKVVGIIQAMLESIALILQARKDNSAEKLTTAEGLADVFSRLFADEVDQFYKEITAKEPSSASAISNLPAA